MVGDIADDLAKALDPVVFSEAAGIVPDKWQRDVLRSTAKRLLLLVTRQGGKSTTVATLCAHTAIYRPGSLIMIISPSERQSKEMFRKIIDVYHALGRPVAADTENKLELELINGSRILARPSGEGNIRGYSGVDLIILDEASRVPDDLYHAVRPMLAVSGGRLIAMTTPFGKRGFFYNAWEDKDANWQRVKVTALDCPRITAEFLAEERRTLPRAWFDAEYMCVFSEAIDNVFTHDLVMGALSANVEPLFGGMSWAIS